MEQDSGCSRVMRKASAQKLQTNPLKQRQSKKSFKTSLLDRSNDSCEEVGMVKQSINITEDVNLVNITESIQHEQINQSRES